MAKRPDSLSETISLDERKALSDFLSISARQKSVAADMEKLLHASLALALREQKGQA